MAVSSRIAAVAAVVGALIGCFTAYVLGVAPSDIGMGLWGYNPVLSMLALGGLAPIIFDWRKAVLLIYGSVFCTIFVGAFHTLLAPVGVPSLTWPFCFATILVVCVQRFLEETASPPLGFS